MKKYLVFFLAAVILVTSVGIGIAAKPSFHSVEIANPVTGDVKNTIELPDRASEKAPGVYYLGSVMIDGELVEGYAFVRRHAKPGTDCGNGLCEPGENANKCPADCGSSDPDGGAACYGFLAKGAKWRTIEPYIVDPANERGLDEASVRAHFATSLGRWETAAETEIFEDEISGIVDGVDLQSPDGKNEVYFGSIADENAIAVTIVWGIFRGAPHQRKLVEWDQLYDEVDFDWSIDCETEACPAKMDFENIATHELGHSAGLDDLYESACSEETMYGYAAYGETNKRTLESGDIAGIQELY